MKVNLRLWLVITLATLVSNSLENVVWAQETVIQAIQVPVNGLSNSASNSTEYSYVIGKFPDNGRVFQHLLRPLTAETAAYPCAAPIWDGRRGQFCSTGGDWRSANDPVDHRMLRFGGGTISNPDLDAPLYPGALIGQFGHSVLKNREIRPYEALFQFHTNNNGTGYICNSFSQGQAFVTRDGQTRDKDDTGCIFMFTAAGQLIVGAETVTRFTSVVIHGDMIVDGCLIVGGKLIAGECRGDIQKAADYEKQILSMRQYKKDDPISESVKPQ